MPIQLNYVTPATGAQATYHVIAVASLDYVGNFVMATVSSYVSKEAKDAGRMPLYQQQIQLFGLPDEDPRPFCEAALVEDKPTDGTAVPSPIRYTFAGGALVD
jgi:hypothetical protein